MANKYAKGASPKHGRDLTGRTRGAILRAFDAVENRGRTIPEILADCFMDQPLRFMDMASKYIIKDVNTDVDTHQSADKLTDDELADIVAKRARARLESAQDSTEGDNTALEQVKNQA